MKILWAKSSGLVPLTHGGRIRSYHLARELARRHEVTLFTFYAAEPEDLHPTLQSIFSHVICIPLDIAEAQSLPDLLRYAGNLFSLKPYSAAKYCRSAVARQLHELVSRERYDVIICDFLLTAAVLPWSDPTPKVLFTHNIEARIWERHYRTSRNPIWKAVSYREYRTMARMEKHYVRRADHVLAVSETDRDFFAQLADPARIHVIPTGVDVEYFRPAPELEKPNTLVFTGSMDWMPNSDGIYFFVENILPRIRQRVPDVRLLVVGRKPPAKVTALAERNASITVTGTVDDIRPYMNAGSVYIVPLWVGGGTRLKIFEAMAAGKAIVSTTIGAEGLPVHDGENILIADEPEAFSRHVTRLLLEQEERRRLGCAARQLVEKNYSWASATDRLEAVLRLAVQKG